MTWQEMVTTFDLEDDVQAFVTGRAVELARERQPFRFRGTRRDCGQQKAHVPHVTGYYDTVRHGELQTFCLGREGSLDGAGTLCIAVTAKESGSPEWPGTAKGHWFIAEPVAAEEHPC